MKSICIKKKATSKLGFISCWESLECLTSTYVVILTGTCFQKTDYIVDFIDDGLIFDGLLLFFLYFNDLWPVANGARLKNTGQRKQAKDKMAAALYFGLYHVYCVCS